MSVAFVLSLSSLFSLVEKEVSNFLPVPLLPASAVPRPFPTLVSVREVPFCLLFLAVSASPHPLAWRPGFLF